MEKKPTDATIRVWTRLVRAHDDAMDRVEGDLRAAGLPPLAWYDALLELEKAGDEGLRPHELERRLLLPQYGLSRLLARMEKTGFVRKQSCEDDGRGHIVTVTAEGREIRRRAWPVYAKAIDAAVGDKMSADEAAILAGLLDKVIARG